MAKGLGRAARIAERRKEIARLLRASERVRAKQARLNDALNAVIADRAAMDGRIAVLRREIYRAQNPAERIAELEAEAARLDASAKGWRPNAIDAYAEAVLRPRARALAAKQARKRFRVVRP